MTNITRQSGRAERLSIPRVIRRTFDVLRHQAGSLLVLSLLTVGLVAGLFGLLRTIGVIADSNDPVASLRGAPGENIVGALASYLLAGGAVRACLAGLNGRRESAGRLWSASAQYFRRAVLIGFLSGLGILLGCLLLIVPGLILWARWFVGIPAGVLEDRQVASALGRSADLTKGQRGAILLLIVIGLLVLLAAVAVLSLLGVLLKPMLPDPDLFGNLVVTPLVTMLGGVLSYAGKTVIHAELTGTVDGMSERALGEVFA